MYNGTRHKLYLQERIGISVQQHTLYLQERIVPIPTHLMLARAYQPNERIWAVAHDIVPGQHAWHDQHTPCMSWTPQGVT